MHFNINKCILSKQVISCRIYWINQVTQNKNKQAINTYKLLCDKQTMFVYF